MAMIYVFIEGKEGCSEYMFWKQISKYIYADKLCIIGCAGIRKVHSCLEAHKLGKDDIGLVVIDTPIDNSAIYADVDDVINFVQRHKNYAIIDTICFEDTILRFKYYSEWLYTLKYRNDIKNHEPIYICLQEYINHKHWWESVYLCSFVDKVYRLGVSFNNRPLKEIASDLRNYHISEENVAANLIEAVTRNSSFKSGLKINKSIFGKCWYCSCFEKKNCEIFYKASNNEFNVKKGKNDFNTCGLINNKKDGDSKIQELYRLIPLYNEVRRVKDNFIRKGFVIANEL